MTPSNPPTTVDEALTQAKASMDQIDSATTACGTAATAIQSRIQRILGQVASAATLQEAQALASQAATEAGNLTTLANTLTSMGTDPVNPVPVAPPVVDPNAP